MVNNFKKTNKQWIKCAFGYGRISCPNVLEPERPRARIARRLNVLAPKCRISYLKNAVLRTVPHSVLLGSLWQYQNLDCY